MSWPSENVTSNFLISFENSPVWDFVVVFSLMFLLGALGIIAILEYLNEWHICYLAAGTITFSEANFIKTS